MVVWGLASLVCAFLCTIGFVGAVHRADARPTAPRRGPLLWLASASVLAVVGVGLLVVHVVTLP